MKITEIIKSIFRKSNIEPLYEMANPRPEDTGLPMCIFISPKGYAKHSAKIKVSREYGHKFDSYNTFTITVDKNINVIGDTGKIKVRDIEKVKKFIVLNKDILIKHWNYEISDKQFLNNLIKVD